MSTHRHLTQRLAPLLYMILNHCKVISTCFSDLFFPAFTERNSMVNALRQTTSMVTKSPVVTKSVGTKPAMSQPAKLISKITRSDH